MISTLLVQVPWLPISVLVLAVLVSPLVTAVLVRHRTAAVVLLGAAVLVVLALTLAPEPDSALSGVSCALQLPYLAPTAVESVANVLLFVPIAVLAGALLPHPALGIPAAIGLSMTVETVQALLPGIGRACDTSDLITNSIGAVLGGAAAVTGRLLASRRERHFVRTPLSRDGAVVEGPHVSRAEF